MDTLDLSERNMNHYPPTPPMIRRVVTRNPRLLSKYLVEGPSVSKAAIPYFIHGLGRLKIIFALRSCSDRQYCPPSHTVLVVTGECCYPVTKEFIGPSALAAKVTCPDL